jgi:DNA-binding response OmpR family regulator
MATPAPPAPILIVEDDFQNGRFLLDLLEVESYAAQLVYGGQEAVALLQGGLRPRALLLDYHLGDMTTAQLLADTTTERAGIPVLLVSADYQVLVQASRLDVAWAGFKPFDLDELLTRLAAALGNG